MEELNKDFEKMNINEHKNKKRNKNHKNKKEENKIEQEEQSKELTEEEKFKEELINLRNKIKDIKVIFDKNKPKKYYEDKIENYLLFENFVNFETLKIKILSIFNNENIFSYLFNLWNKCIEFSKKKSS